MTLVSGKLPLFCDEEHEHTTCKLSIQDSGPIYEHQTHALGLVYVLLQLARLACTEGRSEDRGRKGEKEVGGDKPVLVLYKSSPI